MTAMLSAGTVGLELDLTDAGDAATLLSFVGGKEIEYVSHHCELNQASIAYRGGVMVTLTGEPKPLVVGEDAAEQ